MGRHRLPCDDPVRAAKQARDRAAQARKDSQRRAEAEAVAPRVVGTVVFEPVTCPRCGDVFRSARPLQGYAHHRSGQQCPWSDEAEKAAHKARSIQRQRALALSEPYKQKRAVRLGAQQKVEDRELPALHTGHELFDRARAARRYWPNADFMKAWPKWEDMLSEAVLALLEDRDAAEAIREFVRKEPGPMLSLDAPAPWAPEHALLDVLAA